MHEPMSHRGASMTPMSVCAIAILLLLGCGADSTPDGVWNSTTTITSALHLASERSDSGPDQPSTSAGRLSSDRKSEKPRHVDPEWHKHMRETLPGPGCFRATPPDTVWHPVPCETPPRIPLSPAIVGGSGSDFMVKASGPLTGVWGSFPTVSGPGYFGGPDLTFQVNSNSFITPYCNASPNPNCRGWQQFVTRGSRGVGGGTENAYVYMQYWLLGYNTGCPSGWDSFTDTGPCSGNCCWMNSPGAGDAQYPVWVMFPFIKVSGQVLNGGLQDSVDYWDGYGLTTFVNGEGQMKLSQGWNSAEFNVFGYGNGAQVNFPSGSTMLVRLGIIDGTSAAPTCASGSTTGETNNLTLVPSSCCPTGGPNNLSITFLQSNASPLPPSPFCLLNTIVPTILNPVR